LALLGAIAISWFLFQGNPGSGLFSGQSPGQLEELDLREQQVMRLFDAIPGVDAQEIIIRVDLIPEVQTSVFSTRVGAEREVVQSVVVLYEGTILHPHDITLAISTVLGVGYHNIQLLNLNQLGGN